MRSHTTTRPGPAVRGPAKGFTLAELLIALAILALLLTSIAIAFQASMHNIQENERLSAATQAGRSVLNRITMEVRDGAAIDLSSPSNTLVIMLPDDGSGTDRRTRYTFGGGVLTRESLVNGAVTESQILLGNNDGATVSSFTVTIVTGLDWQKYACAKSVTLALDFAQDGLQTAVTASACPRKNQIY